MSVVAQGGMALVAAAVAAGGAWQFAHDDRTKRLAWLAGPMGAMGVLGLGRWTALPVPAAVALVAGVLVAAAFVDASEQRVPTPLAYMAAGLSLAGLVFHGVRAEAWGEVGHALMLTAGVTLGLAVLWLAGGMGFGDVRLATGLSLAMLRGAGGLVVVLYVAFFAAGGLLLVRRVRRSPRGWLPFGPGLVGGWFLALAWLGPAVT